MPDGGTTDRPFWNEPLETLPRERLHALQEKRLRRLGRQVALHSEFYRRKLGREGVEALPYLSLDEFRQLPVTTKEEIRRDQGACIAEGRAPYANLLCVPFEDIRVERTTSGTTGTPVIVPLTEAEMDESSLVLGEAAMRGFQSAGLRADDILLYCWGLAGTTVNGAANFLPLGGLPFPHFTVIPGHTGKSRLHLQAMREVGVTALFATPSYTRYLTELARSIGIDPRRDLTVRKIFVSGEAGPTSIPAMRDQLRDAWGAECYDVWGQMETRTRAFDCAEQAGPHLAEDLHLFEVLNPDTLEPVPPGEAGVVVVTHLLAEAMPILRYDTRDMVQLDETTCHCGRTGARVMRILGRADDMIKVRGLRFFPTEILRFVQAVPGVVGMARIVLDYDRLGRELFTVQVEFGGNPGEAREFRERLRREVRDAVGLEPGLEVFPSGSLERSMMKTPPLLDLRDPRQRERYQAAMAEVRAF